MADVSALAGVVLNVRAPDRLAAFYSEYLGMNVRRQDDEIRLAYDTRAAYVALRLSPSPQPYRHDRSDRYWKIGITLPNVDLAYAQLKARDINITEPRQFQDIGYLCHITDPEGFQIELLQHTFEGAARTSEGDEKLPLGGSATIGQITLRTSNIERELNHYQSKLGMSLLSKQMVRDFGFDLFFLAFTDETPPNPDITAVQNRPWLWQRPYTTLELQSFPERQQPIQDTAIDQTGYAGLRLEMPTA